MVYNFTSDELFSLIPSWMKSETDTMFLKRQPKILDF